MFLGMLGFGYVLMKFLVFGLADEVLDEGDSIRIRKGKQKFQVPISSISHITHSILTNPPRVTLHVNQINGESTSHSFMLESGGYFFSAPKIVAELRARIKKANQSPQTTATNSLL